MCTLFPPPKPPAVQPHFIGETSSNFEYKYITTLTLHLAIIATPLYLAVSLLLVVIWHTHTHMFSPPTANYQTPEKHTPPLFSCRVVCSRFQFNGHLFTRLADSQNDREKSEKRRRAPCHHFCYLWLPAVYHPVPCCVCYVTIDRNKN